MTPERRVLLAAEDERLRAAARALHGRLVEATGEEAVRLLQEELFDAVLLDMLPHPAVEAALHALAGARRRRLLVVRVGEELEPGDRALAWRLSADLLLRPEDLDALAEHLHRARAEKDRFYAAFEEVRRRTGAVLGAHA